MMSLVGLQLDSMCDPGGTTWAYIRGGASLPDFFDTIPRVRAVQIAKTNSDELPASVKANSAKISDGPSATLWFHLLSGI